MSHPAPRSASRSAIVAFEPGMRIRSQSPGIACPGSTISMAISGSAESGSRSSKLEIRGSRGTATLIPALRFAPSVGSPSTSSAGSLDASAKCGTTPSEAQPVRDAISFSPSSKSEGSPRKRLTKNAFIRVRSSGSRTACVPTSAAITPPRSMSPTSSTGTSAAAAKPMLAISPARRLISAGEPAPSAMTRSASASMRRKLSSTSLRNSPFRALYSRAVSVAQPLPLHDDLRPAVGLGLQEDGVHVDRGSDPRGARLQHLRAADLAAIGCDAGVVRHVLRLERGDAQPAVGKGAAKPGHDQRLADVGAGSLDHDGGGAGHAAAIADRRQPRKPVIKLCISPGHVKFSVICLRSKIDCTL